MQAWQFTEVKAPLKLTELPDPVAGAGEVVIDIKATGLCHSDVGLMDGTLTAALHHVPITLGHEPAGVISSVGDGVTDWAVGDRVAVNPSATSEYVGGTRDGGFATKLLGKVEELIRIPDGVPWEQAAGATDAGVTAYHAVHTTGGVVASTRLGIIGLGGVGFTAAGIGVVAGAEVYGAEIDEGLHARGLELGLKGVVKDVRDLAQFELDVIVDFAGFGTTTAGAIEAVKPKGLVVQVGLGRTEATISTILMASKQLTYKGSWGGTNQDIADLLALMADGSYAMSTISVGFDAIGEDIERVARGEIKGQRLVALVD